MFMFYWHDTVEICRLYQPLKIVKISYFWKIIKIPCSMAKKKKRTIVPFVAVATLILAVLYILTLRKPSAPAEPIRAIPVNAAVIIKINDYPALFEKVAAGNAIWNELRTIPWFEHVNRQLHALDSVFRNVPEAKQILQQPPSFISVHVTGKDRISLMHVLQLPSRLHEKKITALASGLLADSGSLKSRDYEGITIHEAAFRQERGEKSFSFAVYQDILMISSSPILIEDAIRQLALNESVANLDGFRDVYDLAGKNVAANVFINFDQFPRSLAALVTPELRAGMRSVKTFASWAEMDVNILTDMLLMNGFVTPSDSVSSLSSILLHQTPQRLTADEVLPASTASFFSLSLSDPDRYFSDYRDYLQNQGLLTAYNNTLTSLNNAYGIRLPEDLLEIMDNEISLAYDPGSQEGSPVSLYVLIRIKSSTQAEDRLRAMMTRIAAAESMPVEAYTTKYKLDNELSYSIQHLPVRNFTAKVFGSRFSVLDEHYFAVIDNYIVFSSTVESVESLIHNYILNKTLRNDPAFRTFTGNLSTRSNLYFYCNLSKARPVYAPDLIGTISQPWARFEPVFQKVQTLGFQMFTERNLLHNNFLLQYLSAYSNDPQTVWESKLDTLADFKPVFVVNHQTRQNEVFVQDLRNNIYLINQVGRILWKVQLPEPINSEVFQVDYFRNGKLQLLFSTQSTLYLVDRNGNFVDKYPVKLRSPATCGVSVFDYENNHEYRLFIACEDRHVYAYTKEGNLLSGWEFDTSEGEVTQPVEHFRIGDKDFIVFGDRFKTYILDRKGNTRVGVETYFPRSARNTYQLDLPRDGSGPALVTTDTAGKVYFLGFNGKTRTMEPGRPYTDKHFFDYRDLNGDGKPELIYLEGNTLTVYKSDLSRLFTRDFGSTVLSRPLSYQFSATDRKIGVVSRSENRIYLINPSGDLYAGFPLQGNTLFSIGNFGDTLSRFNLVVGSSDNFLYNYRVK
jgi:hypothetical protein